LGNFDLNFANVLITKDMVRLDDVAADSANPTGSSIFTIMITPPKGISLEPFLLWLLSQFSFHGSIDLKASDIFNGDYPLNRATDFTPFEAYTPITVTAANVIDVPDFTAPPSRSS
jgi:hypothetical protein